MSNGTLCLDCKERHYLDQIRCHNCEMLRRQIGLEIEQYAVKGYEGALTSDNPNILATATYIREALFNAAYIARGIKDEE